MAARIAKGPPAAPAPARGPLQVALAAALVGLVLSGMLVRLHGQAHAGIASFCDLSETVSCDKVALSRFSVALGLPVAAWGVLGYGLSAALSAAGLRRRRPSPTWPSGLLFAIGGTAAAASVALALVSKFAIGAWCLLCTASWGASLLLFAAAWRACRGPGPAAALRADLATLRAAPGRTAALLLACLAAMALAAAAWPRYWKAKPAAVRAAPAAAPGSGPAEVVEYSDYQCPMCARAHDETKAFLAGRPDVKLVKRHFPLDPTCNPLVKRVIHESACALARAAICAEAQGRFAEMDDALFANQERGEPPEAIAARLGLDAVRFRACLASPETDRRIAADIAAAARDGVRATPTFVVGGAAVAGRLPAELLPPPRR
ncbi:MAG TPA: vitamin K epoxide reductase family protein [Anaeromyxobacteraceae bacterium]|nr:vitamin K epoxide reductase family protein [Anaeromyxobacteraceae bacterium]